MKQKLWTAKDVEKILLITQDILSLNEPIFNEEGDEVEFGGVIEDPGPTPEEVIIKQGIRDTLVKYMDSILKPREKEVLMYRYGFTTGEPVTLEEIGKILGITRERVRQIEERGLRRLRAKLIKSDIREEDI